MNFLLPFVLLLISCFGASAQMGAEDADYADSTRYRTIIPSPSDTTHYTPFSSKQDKIFVFFERYGKLTCSEPIGQPAYFRWSQLDTTSFTFKPLWIDTVEINKLVEPTFPLLSLDSSKCSLPKHDTSYVSAYKISSLADSLPAGYYQVIIDTLQIIYDTVTCSAFCLEKWNGEDFDTIFVDTTFYLPNSYRIVRADTFATWIFIDTFRVDTVEVLSHDCNWLNVQAIFYPRAINEGYYNYKYFDVWHVPKRIKRNYPDCLDCYIKNVNWEPSRDIHYGASVEDDGEWKKSYFAYIPKPLHDATYTVMVENYFGKVDTFYTDTILAKATVAQLKLFIAKGEGDEIIWEEKLDESPDEYPARIKLSNASINAKLGSHFTWSLFNNLNDYPEDIPLIEVPFMYPQIVTLDSAESVYPPEEYKPGRYPITLHVLNQFGCEDTDTLSFEIEEFLINKSAIPKVFTPNGDGINDVFQLKDPANNVKSLDRIQIHILNRYGQLMFTSEEVLFSWDGKIHKRNDIAPDGVYFYKLKAQGYNNRHKMIKQTLTGNIHLFNGKKH
ncbi:MAG: gliding motility-associated C-terminal domain-containing protein [Bacteroidales bacterium]